MRLLPHLTAVALFCLLPALPAASQPPYATQPPHYQPPLPPPPGPTQFELERVRRLQMMQAQQAHQMQTVPGLPIEPSLPPGFDTDLPLPGTVTLPPPESPQATSAPSFQSTLTAHRRPASAAWPGRSRQGDSLGPQLAQEGAQEGIAALFRRRQRDKAKVRRGAARGSGLTDDAARGAATTFLDDGTRGVAGRGLLKKIGAGLLTIGGSLFFFRRRRD